MGGQQSKNSNLLMQDETSILSSYSTTDDNSNIRSSILNESERLVHDTTSTKPLKKKLHYGKKKMKNIIHYNAAPSSSSLDSNSRSSIQLENDNSISSITTKPFKVEQQSIYPYLFTQYPETKTEKKENSDDYDQSLYNHSQISNIVERRASLPMHQLDCNKYVKGWFNTTNTITRSLSSSSAMPQNHTRRQITSQQLMLDLYLGPGNETERKKEKDRQQRLHYLLKKVWKFTYRPELKEPDLIVHWCCGIGIWDMEMAVMFPNTKVVGIDFKEATIPNLRHGIPNLEFRTSIIHDTITGLESFEDNTVDYIMLRDVWLINAPPSKWDNVLKQAFRILKPGGSIELSEHTLRMKSDGPYSKKLHAWYGKLYDEIKVNKMIATELDEYLERAGYNEIDQLSISIPLGEWASTRDLKEMGYLFRDIIERRARGLSKWVSQVNNVDTKVVNDVITKALVNEVDQYHTCVDWYSYTAKKPIEL